MHSESLEKYIKASSYIDCDEPTIVELAHQLRGDYTNDVDIAKTCFDYVRDHIKHSWDFKIDIITCKASDVLKHQTGYCYAKSHLLAALLRANNIPAGLCYQRLSIAGNGAPYCLHGLNAIYLQNTGWYRADPRGNKSGVNAQFTPPKEQLAFSTNDRYEEDIKSIWHEPLPTVVNALTKHTTCKAVYENLPDVEAEDSP
ncbi:transglutaminase-like domain-containing protein [Eionea flava]